MGVNPRLSSIALDGTQFSPAGASELASLRYVNALSLQGSNLADGDLTHLAKLDKLRDLNVQQTRVTQEGLMNLHKSIPQCAIHHDQGVIQAVMTPGK